MAKDWNPQSWTMAEARHHPAYAEADALARVTGTLGNFPPLVFAGEARALKADLAQVAGEAHLVGGTAHHPHRRQQHAGEHGDDADHHQQLDEGEGARVARRAPWSRCWLRTRMVGW